MRLNIKNPEAHRLAQAIAQATGQTITRVVVDALRNRYANIERHNRRASLNDLRAIANRSAALVQGQHEDNGERR